MKLVMAECHSIAQCLLQLVYVSVYIPFVCLMCSGPVKGLLSSIDYVSYDAAVALTLVVLVAIICPHYTVYSGCPLLPILS